MILPTIIIVVALLEAKVKVLQLAKPSHHWTNPSVVPEVSEEPVPEPELLEELPPNFVVELGVVDVCFVSELDEEKVVVEVKVLSRDKPGVPDGLAKEKILRTNSMWDIEAGEATCTCSRPRDCWGAWGDGPC